MNIEQQAKQVTEDAVDVAKAAVKEQEARLESRMTLPMWLASHAACVAIGAVLVWIF